MSGTARRPGDSQNRFRHRPKALIVNLSPEVAVVLGVLAAVQITLDVIALVDLYRRPVSQVRTGNKWAWVAIILLINLLGAILYLTVGRLGSKEP